VGHFFDKVFGLEGGEGLEDWQIAQLAVCGQENRFFTHLLI
jgi:hypothetical protein